MRMRAQQGPGAPTVPAGRSARSTPPPRRRRHVPARLGGALTAMAAGGLHAVVDAWAAARPDAPGAEDAGAAWSYAELRDASLRAAALLRSRGVGEAASAATPRPLALALPRGREPVRSGGQAFPACQSPSSRDARRHRPDSDRIPATHVPAREPHRLGIALGLVEVGPTLVRTGWTPPSLQPRCRTPAS